MNSSISAWHPAELEHVFERLFFHSADVENWRRNGRQTFSWFFNLFLFFCQLNFLCFFFFFNINSRQWVDEQQHCCMASCRAWAYLWKTLSPQRRCRKLAGQWLTDFSTLRSSVELASGGSGWERQNFPSTEERNMNFYYSGKYSNWPQRARPKSLSWLKECCSPVVLYAHPHLFLVGQY